MASLGQTSQMSVTTATLILQMFDRQYRLDEHGEFVNRIGQRAEQKTLDLVWEAQAVLADAA